MNYLHFAVTYIILQRIFGHITKTVLYEIMKYILYISYCGVCLTLSTGCSYLKPKEIKKELEEKKDIGDYDSDDFEINSEDEYILINTYKRLNI